MDKERLAFELVKIAKDICALESDEEYKKKTQAVQKLFVQIEKHIKQHAQKQKKDPRNWGYVGDMGRIEQMLKEIVEF